MRVCLLVLYWSIAYIGWSAFALPLHSLASESFAFWQGQLWGRGVIPPADSARSYFERQECIAANRAVEETDIVCVQDVAVSLGGGCSTSMTG